MNTRTLSFDVTLTAMNCGQCGGTYAINERYRQQRQQEGNGWTCPYCKTAWGYFKNGENARLKRELEQAEQAKIAALQREKDALAEAEHFRRSRDATKGELTKVKNRIHKGVCPCCNRTFANLANHMKSKHPNYAKA